MLLCRAMRGTRSTLEKPVIEGAIGLWESSGREPLTREGADIANEGLESHRC